MIGIVVDARAVLAVVLPAVLAVFALLGAVDPPTISSSPKWHPLLLEGEGRSQS